MTPNEQTVQHRRTWTHEPERVRVEDVEGEGLWKVRMPLASTAEARDGRALERDVIEGWREQISNEPLPLFLDHGSDDLTGHRYGQLGRVGYWTDPETVERDDGIVDLEADAVVVGPEAVDEDAGQYREALSWLRTQAELLPLASSAGWNEDTGSRDPPGGFDLMEGSLVGLPSDERTTTASADPVAVARAVEAASEEFDAETFLRALNGETRDNETMSDDTESGDETEPDTEHDEEPTESEETENRAEKDKYDRLMERMDNLEQMNEREVEMLERMSEDYDDDDSDDDEDGGENSSEPDEGDDTRDEPPETDRTVEIDGKEMSADEALDALREVAAADPEPDESEFRDVGEGTEADETRDDEPDDGDETPSFSFS